MMLKVHGYITLCPNASEILVDQRKDLKFLLIFTCQIPLTNLMDSLCTWGPLTRRGGHQTPSETDPGNLTALNGHPRKEDSPSAVQTVLGNSTMKWKFKESQVYRLPSGPGPYVYFSSYWGLNVSRDCHMLYPGTDRRRLKP